MCVRKLSFVVLVCVLLGGGPAFGGREEARGVPRAVRQAEALGRAVNWAASRALPSVVRVSAEREVEAPVPAMPSGVRERLKEVAPNLKMIPPEPPRPQQKITRKSHGRGVVLDEQGHVLTCHHTVAEAKRITVTTRDGRSLEATLVGSDPRIDVALLKVESADLQPATLGSSDDLYVGQPVVALGGLPQGDVSVSFGVVSALHQSPGAAPLEDAIQFDATVAPGSGGGPLINLRGEVVGLIAALHGRGPAIGSAIRSRVPAGAYPHLNLELRRPAVVQMPWSPAPGGGFGFAIPVSMIRDVLDELKAGETVQRGFLGIGGRDLTPEDAQRLGYEGDGGVLVQQVLEGSAAEKAGLETDDVIVKWAGREVTDFGRLRLLIARRKPGETVKVHVWRDGELKTLEVTLGRRKQTL